MRITGQFYDDDMHEALLDDVVWGWPLARGRDPLVRRLGGGKWQNAIKFPNPKFLSRGVLSLNLQRATFL